MLIQVKNKDTMVVGNFTFRCCVGKNGTKKHKIEGDKSTPKGTYSLGKIYFRNDRVKKPPRNFKVIKIKSNIGWCNDTNSKYYNKQIFIKKKIRYEKLYRKDNKYDYFIVINYNTKKTIPNKGSAIFIHLTKTFSPTLGCVAIKKSDFLILLKIINKNTKIKIY